MNIRLHFYSWIGVELDWCGESQIECEDPAVRKFMQNAKMANWRNFMEG